MSEKDKPLAAAQVQKFKAAGVTDTAHQQVAQQVLDLGISEASLFDWISQYGPGLFAMLKLLLESFKSQGHPGYTPSAAPKSLSVPQLQKLKSAGVTDSADQQVAQQTLELGIPQHTLLDWINQYGAGILAMIKLLLEAFRNQGSEGYSGPSMLPKSTEPPTPPKDVMTP